MKKLFNASIVVLALALPYAAYAQQAVPKTFKELVGILVKLLNSATTLLVLLAIVAFLFGTTYNIYKANEGGASNLRKFLMWGIVTLFVMVSVWGILQLLQETLFGDGTSSRTGAAQTGVGAQPY